MHIAPYGCTICIWHIIEHCSYAILHNESYCIIIFQPGTIKTIILDYTYSMFLNEPYSKYFSMLKPSPSILVNFKDLGFASVFKILWLGSNIYLALY